MTLQTSELLAGRVALVTGGSRGLGREVVEAFAAAGADVVIAGRKIDSCKETAAKVRAEYGVRALPVAANVGDWADCDALIEAAYGEFGRVDILVNNAGISPLYPSLDAVGESLFDKVIGVNLRGPFRLCAEIGTRMAAGDGGSIINISSVAATRSDVIALPYSAAKAGLNNVTEGFAQAFGPKVRVNAIQCGPFETDIAKAWPAEFRAQFESAVALGRPGRPDEIIGAALYFASDASSFCTGSILRLDGGIR
ncbi:putative short chain dehydrogenase/reductase [Nocardia rhizosphaerihabitans]|uniref:Short chain dehydrogenase/reductase n=1 Tax=Nocardia rhizosphaerihabitans TaxID=1691570 RepID=A0ABQ2KGU9_9NOCA|nr:putative short chain dehydrogenase/reductase [Nocardia rhizosphaerihabitans]